MIIIINGAWVPGPEAVARLLVERLTNGALVGPAPERLRALREEGVDDFVLPGVFPSGSSLRKLRRELAPMDATSYAFRLTRDPSALTPDARELQERQEREAMEGDVGLPVPDLPPDEAARFIWDDVHEPVDLAPWSPSWSRSFELERAAIQSALGDRVRLLEHVGSTAVEGLSAKPIVDIVLAVPSLERMADYLPALRELGYHFLDYPTNVDRYFFKKGRPRTHHLHVGGPGTRALMDQVRFRDLLRESSELRERYEALKADLERRFRDDRARYSESKSAFIAEVLGGSRG